MEVIAEWSPESPIFWGRWAWVSRVRGASANEKEVGRKSDHDGNGTYQPVEKGATDRVSLHGEAYRGEGGFAIVRDDEDDLSDQDGASGCNKHEQGAISARHGLFRGAGADKLAHQQ